MEKINDIIHDFEMFCSLENETINDKIIKNNKIMNDERIIQKYKIDYLLKIPMLFAVTIITLIIFAHFGKTTIGGIIILGYLSYIQFIYYIHGKLTKNKILKMQTIIDNLAHDANLNRIKLTRQLMHGIEASYYKYPKSDPDILQYHILNAFALINDKIIINRIVKKYALSSDEITQRQIDEKFNTSCYKKYRMAVSSINASVNSCTTNQGMQQSITTLTFQTNSELTTFITTLIFIILSSSDWVLEAISKLWPMVVDNINNLYNLICLYTI